MTLDERLQRLYALDRAGVTLASPQTSLGREARRRLESTTGLSPEGIELAFAECFEAGSGRAVLSQLARQAPPAPHAHVILSANVFVAAYRAIALALCQSPRVSVRASRREPAFTELLWETSGEAFSLVDDLSPAPGDHVWAYGSDATLEHLRDSLPPGVHFHAHGSGMGAVVIRQTAGIGESDLLRAADRLAQDIVAFDQRGCLSPRVGFVLGEPEFQQRFGHRLASALADWEETVPRGRLSESEAVDGERYLDTCSYVGQLLPAGSGSVFVDHVVDRVIVPPVGRHLHLCRTSDALASLRALGSRLTSVAFFEPENLPGQCHELIGPRRYVELGRMQRPPLDGPVDLRTGWRAELL